MTDRSPRPTTLRRRDVAKILALTAMRKINQRSLERWSRWSFDSGSGRATGVQSTIVSASEMHSSKDRPEEILPPKLRVLKPLPSESLLSRGYVLPYYGLAAVAFAAHRRFPIGAYEWDRFGFYASLFPPNEESWSDIQDDEQFASLRLQGPNPFLLTADGDNFVVNYGPPLDGVWAPVCCRFAVERGRFVATAIEIDGRVVERGHGDDWESAKRVANALDARYAIFGQHLTTSHFLVAQAFAIAARELVHHPLGPLMRLLTRGVLHVNQFALQLLLREESYFRQSNFVPAKQLFAIVEKRVGAFAAAELTPDEDIRRRKIDRIPGHPYVEDALDAWDVIRRFTDEVVRRHYAKDDAIRGDDALQTWHAQLIELLPNCAALQLQTREDLVIRLASLVYNNVVHEVSGDFSPYTGARTVDAKKLVSFKGLTKTPISPPALTDVFLFEQGAYAGTFNVAGNNLMRARLAGRIRDADDIRSIEKFRAALRDYERRVDERNQYRPRPFLRMRPSQWEWSVSF